MSVAVAQEVDLFPYNTFGLHARVQQMVRISSPDELKEAVAANTRQLPFFILGGGSNLLLTQDLNCFMLKNECKGIALVQEDDDCVYLKVGGGVVWHDFVMHCVEHNWGGVENLALIPGTVGAAPIQNIGAYGVEVKEVIETVHTYDLAQDKFVDFANEDCAFGYRESLFKRQYKNKLFVYAVTLRLHKKHNLRLAYGAIQETIEAQQLPLTIQSVAQVVIHIRQSKLPDPKEVGNSGSFFKNPEVDVQILETIKAAYPQVPHYYISEHTYKIPAGWLIEQCGWKGFREGSIGVHPKQALVLVNYGGGDGQSVYELSERILASVKDRFGIDLEREVQVY